MSERFLEDLFYYEELVPQFSGVDKAYPVHHWIQDLEENAEVFEWNLQEQLIIAKRSLVGTAMLWLKGKKPFKEWADLKAALIKDFSDAMDLKTIHEMMSERKKKKEESYLDYMYILRELGRRGKLSDVIVIKYIIEGIDDVEKNKTILYGANTFEEFKEKLLIYQEIKEKVDKQKKTSFKNDYISSIQHFKFNEESQSEDLTESQTLPAIEINKNIGPYFTCEYKKQLSCVDYLKKKDVNNIYNSKTSNEVVKNVKGVNKELCNEAIITSESKNYVNPYLETDASSRSTLNVDTCVAQEHGQDISSLKDNKKHEQFKKYIKNLSIKPKEKKFISTKRIVSKDSYGYLSKKKRFKFMRKDYGLKKLKSKIGRKDATNQEYTDGLSYKEDYTKNDLTSRILKEQKEKRRRLKLKRYKTWKWKYKYKDEVRSRCI